jgi:hypothetical protein
MRVISTKPFFERLAGSESPFDFVPGTIAHSRPFPEMVTPSDYAFSFIPETMLHAELICRNGYTFAFVPDSFHFRQKSSPQNWST